MSIIPNSSYEKPNILFNRHMETIIPALLRKVEPFESYLRERIDTPDGDFLDLDWVPKGNKRLVILSHGLEGDSQRPYMKGMARAFSENGWDVLAWNFRGCSSEVNRTRIFYHSGATYDLETVIGHAIKKGYGHIVLVGFSLGANLTLKYLGESTTEKFDEVKQAAVFSVPLDLAGCSREIDLPHNLLYAHRFLRSLKKKVKAKTEELKGNFDIASLDSIGSIYDFDDQFTAPLHGFDGADHYYETCSSRNFLNSIKIRTLVINAQNDPFLSDTCLDGRLFEGSKNVFFESPKYGGHVGFSSYNGSSMYWSEKRALEFLNEEMEKYD